MDYKELGNRVREARTIYGMSDAELAEVLHVSRQYINRKRKAIIKSLKERYKSRMWYDTIIAKEYR